MGLLLAWSWVFLIAVGALFVVALVVRRIRVARRERQESQDEVRIRPLVLDLLEGTGDPGPLPAGDERAFASLLTRYARRLTGSERSALAGWFERTGRVESQQAALSRYTAWRRATAAYALGDMGSAHAVPALLSTLDDGDREVRAAAARSLGRLDNPAAVAPLVASLLNSHVPRGVAASALLGLGSVAVPELRRLVADEDAQVRAVAVELLGLIGCSEDDALVTARLRDGSAEVRAKAARALGRLGAEMATSELRLALADRIPFVRAAAANALGVIDDREAAPALLEVALNDSFDPAQAAARALARVDPRALALADGGSPALSEAVDRLQMAAA